MPAFLQVEGRAPIEAAADSDALVDELDTLARIIGTGLRFTETPATESRGVVHLDERGVEVVLPAGFRARLDWNAVQLVGESAEQVAGGILLAVALAIGAAGHADVACHTVSGLAQRDLLRLGESMVPWIATMYCNDRRQAELVQLATRVLHAPAADQDQAARHVGLASSLLELVWLSMPRDAHAAREPVVDASLRLATSITLRNWPIEIAHDCGVLVYNIAHFVGLSRSSWRDALSLYRSAARMHTGYRKRYYFWSELAGLLFDGGRFRWSAAAYAKAVALSPNSAELVARYADALTHARDFAAARDAFDRYVTLAAIKDEDSNLGRAARFEGGLRAQAAWILKAYAFPHLLAALHAPSQPESADGAEDAFDSERDASAGDHETTAQWLASASRLRSDPLDTLAWFNRGVAANQLGDLQEAQMAFLLAALFNRGDLEAWANAAALAINEKNDELATHIIWAGFEANGDGFVRALASLFSQRSPEAVSELRQMLHVLLATESYDPAVQMRIPLEDGSVAVVSVAAATED